MLMLMLALFSVSGIDGSGDVPCNTNTGQLGTCVPSNLCQPPRVIANSPFSFRSLCRLAGNAVGHCCPHEELQTPNPIVVRIGTANPVDYGTSTRKIFSSQSPSWSVSPPSPLSPGAVRIYGERAFAKIKDMEDLESVLYAKGLVVREGTTEFLHQASLATDQESLNLGKKALVNDRASKEIASHFTLPGRSIDDLSRVSVHNTNLNNSCQQVPNCRSSFYKYRTIDGTCNNELRRHWGAAFTAFERLVPPAYGDGVSLPRSSIGGHPLPSSRRVSTAIVSDVYKPDLNHSLLLMQWGQFVDHDLQLTPIFTGKAGSGITCCHQQILSTSGLRHPECLEISIPHNDSFFGQFHHTCMEFVRSLPAPRSQCNLGTREQMNRVTSFIDASTVYGSSDREMRSLRSLSKGKLRSQPCEGHEFPPFKRQGACHARHQFAAGDTRANQHLHLTALHTLWVREHNRIAEEFVQLNPEWSDEIIFQETRRLVVAQIQHITYNEFLPILLGVQMMHVNELVPLEEGFLFAYDAKVNPTIMNDFSTAAFRFGHSLVQGVLHLSDQDAKTRNDQVLSFRDQFLSNYQLHSEGFLDKTLQSLLRQNSQKMDVHFSHELTRHLFERHNSFGLDLVALDIQRGRDHGLPGYNKYRKHCKLTPAFTFDSLKSEMDEQVVDQLKQVYSHVDDIDLFIGGIAETPIPGALIGPTFACIIAEQFARLKRGDRFWYENGRKWSSFSEGQLYQLRKSSLARIICDNSNVHFVQQQAFYTEAAWNPSIPCDSKQIPRVNLKAWKNEPIISN